MAYELMALPYAMDALEPHMSAETLSYHYGKHHAASGGKLNALTEGTAFAGMALEDIVKSSEGALYNNAAQVYNHDFFWHSLSPEPSEPSGRLAALLEKKYGSVEGFKTAFLDAAATLFGSGWVWLTVDAEEGLHIEQTGNAENPLGSGRVPLLTCDVWEHAYYVDYRNARPSYLEGYWKLINWAFVSENLAEFEQRFV